MNHSLNEDLFNHDEKTRYQRHFLLNGVGAEGQAKLKSARVLCAGAGALGCAVLPILTSAGVGTIGICDDDVIELSNLQRQTLYRTDEIGLLKSAVATNRLCALNPEITIIDHATRMTAANAIAIAQNYDLIIDCTDNLTSRYLLSVICVRLNIPYIYGGISQFKGQCAVLSSQHLPCYHCLFPEYPQEETLPNCAEGGVLSSLPMLIGSLQANEAFKLILNIGSTLAGKLLCIDALNSKFTEYEIHKRNNCEVCTDGNDLSEISKFIKSKDNCSPQVIDLTTKEAKIKLAISDYVLIDVREVHEREQKHIGGYHFPLSSLLDHVDEIKNLNKPILLYCASGIRSKQAAEWLKINQIECYNLKGGIKAWLEET